MSMTTVSSRPARPSPARPDVAELFAATPSRALAIYAHPDDAEVSCGGTMARWSAAGAEVHVVVCTRGDKGSSDPGIDPAELADRRAGEVAAAGQALGLAGHCLLGYDDGALERLGRGYGLGRIEGQPKACAANTKRARGGFKLVGAVRGFPR